MVAPASLAGVRLPDPDPGTRSATTSASYHPAGHCVAACYGLTWLAARRPPALHSTDWQQPYAEQMLEVLSSRKPAARAHRRRRPLRRGPDYRPAHQVRDTAALRLEPRRVGSRLRLAGQLTAEVPQ